MSARCSVMFQPVTKFLASSIVSNDRHRDLLYGSSGAGSVYAAGQIEFVKF